MKPNLLNENKLNNSRSYQLDFLKFFLTLLIFICHTNEYITENTRIVGDIFPIRIWGNWVVQLFFMISGFLMVNSFMKRKDLYLSDPGEATFIFLKAKIKSFAQPYLIGFFFAFITFSCINILKGRWSVLSNVIDLIPDFLGFSAVDNFSRINSATWYVSDMLFCMIPLFFILCKNHKFFLYVLSPILALTLYGIMYNIGFNGAENAAYGTWIGLCTGGVLRGFCGLSFGAISYVIYEKALSGDLNKRKRVLITIIEIILYIIIIPMLLLKADTRSFFAVYPLFAVNIAIIFSGQSYASRLFKYKWMSCLAPLSLSIYFTHLGTSKRLVDYILPNGGYRECALLMAAITVGTCIAYFITVKLINIISPKLSKYFNEEKSVKE